MSKIENLPQAMHNGTLFDLFSTLDGGFFLPNAEQAIQDVVSEVGLRQKSGKVTIELDIDWNHKADAIFIFTSVKSKMPPKPKKAALFFMTPDGKLSRQDLRQPDMFVAPSHA